MPRGRKSIAPAEKIGPEYVGKTPAEDAVPEAASNQRLTALVKTLHYDGALREDALVDDIRFHQHRSAESIFEIGKRLLLLKELVGHGQFQKRLETLGMHYRSAARFMAVTLKFSKSDNPALLSAAGNQSKLLELTVLDDEELSALESGETVGTLTLDKLERMSHQELRAEIRKLKADTEVLGERITKLTTEKEQADQRANKAARAFRSAPVDEQRKQLELAVVTAEMAVRTAIARESDANGEGLKGAIQALFEHAEANGHDVRPFLGDVIARLILELQLVRDNESWPVPIPVHTASLEG